jgi:hypothetical protein
MPACVSCKSKRNKYYAVTLPLNTVNLQPIIELPYVT